jgi:ubiquinol-cytochrome c reductase cytochrome c subunit
VRFLSARRRHRYAGAVVVLFALVAAGGIYTLASPSPSASAEAAQSTQVDEGRKLFAVGCGSCHGLNAQGIPDKGPSLIGVGAASVDFQVSTGRMPAQQPGPQMPRKKPVYNPEETSKLAAYVASLGPGPAIPAREAYATEELSDAEIAEGGELFRTNCASCHNVVGKGGALTWGKDAPPLNDATPEQIYEAMLTGPAQMPVFSDQVITPHNKKQIIGYLETIENEPSRGGFSLGGLGPVPEGLAAWIIGIGILVVIAVWIAAKGVKDNGSQRGAQAR